MTAQSFYRTVMDLSEEADEVLVRRTAAAVLGALRDCLTPPEAAHVRAQLPAELKDVWDRDDTPACRPSRLAPERFYTRVAREAELTSPCEARWMTLAVFAALRAQLSPGEADRVFAQLPQVLKEVWEDAQRSCDDGEAVRRATPVRVQDVMSPDPITIGPTASLRTARAVMIEREVRHLPVVEGGDLVGIITDRDLRSAAVAPALREHLSASARRRLRRATAPLDDLEVRDAMTWTVVTTSRAAPIAQAAAIMHERRIGSLPVVEQGALVGIVTERDALRALAATLAPVRGADPDTYFW